MMELIMVVSGGILVFAIVFALYRVASRLTALSKQLDVSKAQLAKEIEHQQYLKQKLGEIENNILTNRIDDPLTGLPSQQTLQDRLTQIINESERYHFTFAVMVLDLDGFRLLKNVLGLDACNQLLKEVALRLRNSIRPMDTLCRADGSEFLFLIPQLAKPETAAYVAKRLIECIAQPFVIQEQDVFLTASIGIAVYPQDGTQVGMLIQNADQALLQAKSNGNNSYQFYQKDMHAFSQRELALSSSLHNTDTFRQFVLHYQPWVDTTTKKIIGMEAFMHWNHPEYGMIPQQDVRRLVEKSGNVLAIGEWFLRQACQQLQQWQTEGFNPNTVAISISLKQLENPHFVYQVSKILQETELTPANVIFQLSEITLVNKISMVEKSLRMLQRLGIQICVDHFGTGNIALQHLKGLPINLIKMDKAIINDLETNIESQAIVKMIIALANTLKLRVIADGLETPQQKEHLKLLNCDIMQGSIICAAMPAAEFNLALTEKIAASEMEGYLNNQAKK